MRSFLAPPNKIMLSPVGFVRYPVKSEGWHFKEVSARQIRLRCLVVSTRVEEEDEPISDW